MDETTRSPLEQHLSPEVLDRLAKLDLRPHTESALITAAFLRIANWARICRILGDERAVELLNFYYPVIFPVLWDNAAMVLDVLGPDCFVVWGAPVAQENHASLALQTCIDLTLVLRECSAEAHARFGIDLQIRVGVHSGMARVGNIGASAFMMYRAIGFTVQIAWALLDEAQQRNLPVLFSEETRKLLPENAPLRSVASGVVEEIPLQIFTLNMD